MEKLPDPHLLGFFEALMRERQVSRAATRMNVSQSTMSEALARLRAMLGDPLLVRGREGIVPTPRALELMPRVRAIVEQYEGLSRTAAEFDPRTEARAFRVIASDYAQFMLMPRMIAEFAGRSPGSSVEVLAVHVRQLEPALESGEADLAIGLVLEPAEALRRKVLFRERSVCIAQRGHRALQGTLDAAQFAALAHIHVAPSGLRYFSAALDDALEAMGLARHVVFTSPHFLLAAHVVANTDTVVLVPERIARRLAATLPVAVFEPPLELPRYEIAMLWHERTHASAPHAWVREVVADILPKDGG